MIQNLMKQMSQQLTQNVSMGPGLNQFGGAGDGSADAFDLNSLLGGGGLTRGGFGGGFSNTDTMTLNSF